MNEIISHYDLFIGHGPTNTVSENEAKEVSRLLDDAGCWYRNFRLKQPAIHVKVQNAEGLSKVIPWLREMGFIVVALSNIINEDGMIVRVFSTEGMVE